MNKTYSYKETYVFYSELTRINGDTYKKRALGLVESSLTYLCHELNRCGKEVIVFCDTSEPGIFDGVRYEHFKRFSLFAARNIVDVFIAVQNPSVFMVDVKARVRALWLLDVADGPYASLLEDNVLKEKIDYIVAVSEGQKRELVKRYKFRPELIFLSRVGIKKSLYNTIRGKRKKRIVYTASPFRGLDFMLEIFPEIRRQCPGAELVVYSGMDRYGFSDEDDKKAFGRLYEKCEGKGIRLKKSIPHTSLSRELMCASVLAYPHSIREASNRSEERRVGERV